MVFRTMKQPIILLLVVAFFHAHVAHAKPAVKDQDARVRAAYLGTRYVDTDPVFKKRLDARMQGLFDELQQVTLIQPTAVEGTLGKEALNAFLAQPDKQTARQIAEQLDVAYLFWGRMHQQQTDSERILIVGELDRYDRETDVLHRVDVVKYYDVIGVEFLSFKQQYVQTIQPQIVGKKVLWPWVVAGFALLTVLTLKVIGASFGSNGEDGGGDPTIRF